MRSSTLSLQLPMSSDISDGEFNSLRRDMHEMLEANQKLPADLNLARTAVREHIEFQNSHPLKTAEGERIGKPRDPEAFMKSISDGTWNFLIQCSASDAGRDVWFDVDDRAHKRQSTDISPRRSDDDLVKWVIIGFVILIIFSALQGF